MIVRNKLDSHLCKCEICGHKYTNDETCFICNLVKNRTDEDKPRNHSWTELKIEGGTITTDMVTFKKLIDLCGDNGIKLIIINGVIKADWTPKRLTVDEFMGDE